MYHRVILLPRHGSFWSGARTWWTRTDVVEHLDRLVLDEHGFWLHLHLLHLYYLYKTYFFGNYAGVNMRDIILTP